jgi:para-nitrobenzyl esterase
MKKLLIAVFLVLGLALAGSLLLDDTSTLPVSIDDTDRVIDEASIRLAPAGKFVGFSDAYDTHGWLGVPFAESPLGDLRWRAPLLIEESDVELQALSFQEPCIQFWSPLSGVAGEEGQLVGSENCLYLNIWTPQFTPETVPTGDQKLPVMVWIHGGGNTIGTANTYSGHHLAGSQEVVYVALSYRLGILGWFSHDSIRATSESPEDASGNYGLLDMIAALQWVQQNISAFGGDPDNVTIFGESAGGRDVYALLGSPLAKGLFHRAIVQSGSAGTTVLSRAENFIDDPEPGMALGSNELISALMVEQGESENQTAARKLLQSDSEQETMRFMRELSVQELFSVIPLGPFGMYKSPQNIRDGHVLPKESLLQRFANKDDYNSVPMILGTNRDESKIFLAQNPEFVSQWFGVIPRIKNVERYNHIAAYMSDQWKALSVDEPALVLSETQGDVYAYRFDWDESPSNWLVDLPTLLGAGHGLEVAYVFGDFEGGINIPFVLSEENEPGRLVLSNAMMNYWGEFARSGSPGRGRDGEQVQWTAWKNEGDTQIILDAAGGGGIRMSDTQLTAEDLKQRLRDDRLLSDQRALCRLYANFFINGFQLADFWRQDEYDTLGEGGCREYPPHSFEN